MLHGAVVWSDHPYAHILKVDTTAAKAAPGVHRIITADDVPGLNAHGRTVPDQPVFAHDYVRFTGDPIALVLADTREHAAAAVELVTVEYEPLAGLFHPRDALADGAPQLVYSAPGNVCKALVHEVGDIEAAFASAAHVVEGHFTTQRQDHAYLEPLACLAEVRDGTVIVHVPQQAPFETREQLTKILDLPRERIRIISTPPGGALRRQARDPPRGHGRGRGLGHPAAGQGRPAAWREPPDVGQAPPVRARLPGRRRRGRPPPRRRRQARLRQRPVHRQQPPGHRPGLHLQLRPLPGPERPASTARRS